MEQDFSLKIQQADLPDCILKSQTSELLLNNDGLQYLQETIEAVRVAIHKINVFKHYLKQQNELSYISKSDCNTVESFTNEVNENGLMDKINLSQVKPPIQSLNDVNLQVFFTIPDNKIAELEVREAFEKEGFEDFVITIKNRVNHTFGFIKFSNEESVNRAVDTNLKILVNGQLIKIRPHKSVKSNIVVSGNHNEDANSVSKEIDEGLLINISSGYQNHRRILTNCLESVTSQLEQSEEKLANSEVDNSFYHSSEAELMDLNKSNFINSVEKNQESTSAQSGSYSNKTHFEMEWSRNEDNAKSIYKNINHSSGKNRFTPIRKQKKLISNVCLQDGGKEGFQRYNTANVLEKPKNKKSKNFNRYYRHKFL